MFNFWKPNWKTFVAVLGMPYRCSTCCCRCCCCSCSCSLLLFFLERPLGLWLNNVWVGGRRPDRIGSSASHSLHYLNMDARATKLLQLGFFLSDSSSPILQFSNSQLSVVSSLFVVLRSRSHSHSTHAQSTFLNLASSVAVGVLVGKSSAWLLSHCRHLFPRQPLPSAHFSRPFHATLLLSSPQPTLHLSLPS